MADATKDHNLVDVQPYARFHIEPRTLDVMPIGTFLVSVGKTYVDGPPETVMRLVKPGGDTSRYPSAKLTAGGRLLYYFWNHTDGSVKKLGMASTSKTWRWIVQPGEEGFDTLDAFKILCDHRRGKQVPTTLLYRALGLDITP